jgi:hypothetical protein
VLALQVPDSELPAVRVKEKFPVVKPEAVRGIELEFLNTVAEIVDTPILSEAPMETVRLPFS